MHYLKLRINFRILLFLPGRNKGQLLPCQCVLGLPGCFIWIFLLYSLLYIIETHYRPLVSFSKGISALIYFFNSRRQGNQKMFFFIQLTCVSEDLPLKYVKCVCVRACTHIKYTYTGYLTQLCESPRQPETSLRLVLCLKCLT